MKLQIFDQFVKIISLKDVTELINILLKRRPYEGSLTSWKFYSCEWELIHDWQYIQSPNNNKHWNRKTTPTCPSGISFVRDVAFSIQRSQKPLCITAFKFSILSLKSFTAILSTSLSYFTLLQSLVEKNE